MIVNAIFFPQFNCLSVGLTLLHDQVSVAKHISEDVRTAETQSAAAVPGAAWEDVAFVWMTVQINSIR